MDTDSFIVYIKTDDINKEIAKDFEKSLIFQITNWKDHYQNDLMKDKLVGKIMKEFVGLRAKTFSYLLDDISEDKKKLKAQKTCIIKRKLKFENYKSCLKTTRLDNKINPLEKNQVNVNRFKENYKEFIKKQLINIKTPAKI